MLVGYIWTPNETNYLNLILALTLNILKQLNKQTNKQTNYNMNNNYLMSIATKGI